MSTPLNDYGQLGWARRWLSSEHDTVTVPVASLQPGNSPRLHGESKRHTRMMAEAGEMPPIIVHQPTMQVIDGLHRLRAACLRGQDSIAVWWFDGAADEAFVLAVAANTTHGMPLTLKERKAAAVRILGLYPQCSDRAIAAAAGLSHNTVAAIRRKWPTGQIDQLARRRGRDGKSRPLSFDSGREAAAELIRADRGKSLRQIATEANVSRGTVRDVRDRIARVSARWCRRPHAAQPLPCISRAPKRRSNGSGMTRPYGLTTRARRCCSCSRTARRPPPKPKRRAETPPNTAAMRSLMLPPQPVTLGLDSPRNFVPAPTSVEPQCQTKDE